MDVGHLLQYQSFVKSRMDVMGYDYLAEDAAQDYAVDILEGRAIKQTVKHYCIDFLRKSFGDLRSDSNARFLFAHADEIRDWEHYTEEDQLYLRDALKLIELAEPKQHSLLLCYFIFGYTLEECGIKFKQTEARMWQRVNKSLQQIRERIKIKP